MFGLFSSKHKFVSRLGWLCLCGLFSAVLSAQPSTFLVGSDGACDYDTIQEAINGAASMPGPDFIHIANNLTYTQQALTIGGQDVVIIGGYANCSSATPSGSTTINGAGGSAQTVIRISGAGVRDFSNLLIRGGDSNGSNYGGGIQFSGSGDLILRSVSVSNNASSYGGGIYFNGSGGLAILTLETNTVILNNTAQNSGGGIYINGSARLFMLRDRTTVQGNTAVSGDGGGIAVQGPARADIASPGYINFGAITNNTARRGGGIAAFSSGDGDVKVRFFGVDASKPVRINGNRATEKGGAMWLKSYAYPGGSRDYADACALDILIDGNRAPEGAAVYQDYDPSTFFYDVPSTFSLNGGIPLGGNSCDYILPETPDALGRAPCVTGANSCNFIANNVAETSAGVQTNGAIVYNNHSVAEISNAVLIGNFGGNIIHGDGNSSVRMRANLVIANSISSDVIQITGDSPNGKEFIDNTIAGNVIGGATHVLRFDSSTELTIKNNIIWQPGKLTLLYPGGGQNLSSNNIQFNVVSDASTLPQGPFNYERDPQFIDPGTVNYGLRISSPALDFSLPVVGNDLGIDGRPRDQQVRPGGPRAFVRDAGALERQPPDPYLINGTFDGSLRMWTNNFTDYTAWAAFDDGVGGGSGSANMFVPGDQTGTPGGIQLVSINGLTQCFSVPWEGTYKLKARGFTKPDNSYVFPDFAGLHWKLRFNSLNCTGPVNAEGHVLLPNAVGWNSATVLAIIPISLADWNFQTTLEIDLEALQNLNDPALQNPIFVRMDNVVLEYDGVGPLFSDGFENGDLR